MLGRRSSRAATACATSRRQRVASQPSFTKPGKVARCRNCLSRLEPLVKRFLADAAITAALAFFAEVVFAGVARAADTDLRGWFLTDITVELAVAGILNGRRASGVRCFAGGSRRGWLKRMVHC